MLDFLRANFETLPSECVTPEANTAASYNVEQALIAVGNGGLSGMGWTQGTQNQLRFLRVRHTDFIFSVIAEELGLVGAALTLLLLVVCCLACLAHCRPGARSIRTAAWPPAWPH